MVGRLDPETKEQVCKSLLETNPSVPQVKMTGACNEWGQDRDASVTYHADAQGNPVVDSICLSAERLSAYTRGDLDKQLPALILHEFSHVAGYAEKDAIFIQTYPVNFLKLPTANPDQSDVNARSFRAPSNLQQWARLAPQAFAVVILGGVVVSRAAGFHAVHEHYDHVRSAWAQIPAVCRQDIPLTEFQSGVCDRLWKIALSRLGVVLVPALSSMAWVIWTRRRQKALYAEVRSRIRAHRDLVSALGCRGCEHDDLFSWFYSLKPVRVLVGTQDQRVYVSEDTPDLTGSESLSVYEVGRFFGRMRRVAVLEKSAPLCVKIDQQVA